MKIACVGDFGVDFYTNLHIKKPGGIAFNFAINVMEEKEKASLISAIGSDTAGKKLKLLLKKTVLDSSQIAHLQGKTAKQKINLQTGGERKFIGYTPGVLKHWKLSQKDLNFIENHDAVFVPLSDGMEHIFHSILNLNTHAVKIADFSEDSQFADFDKEDNIIRKYSPYFDINFIGGSKKHIQMITTVSEKYMDKLFVLTLGKEGSIAFIKGVQVEYKPHFISLPIDTNGCGDAFQAAFVISYLKSKNISDSLQNAASKAEKILQQIGSTNYSL